MKSNKSAQQIRYFLSTNSGSPNGLIKENLREIPVQNLGISVNFTEMYQIKTTI